MEGRNYDVGRGVYKSKRNGSLVDLILNSSNRGTIIVILLRFETNTFLRDGIESAGARGRSRGHDFGNVVGNVERVCCLVRE